ncbi:prepilin-type N-terminal cleavage/methylation domain-containing protein [Desulfonatronovibrio magnus]|uniref:prepilin-type N-terminal cleavage/methylation domain-containing protein n=1 Tax=Desulfonatronovibrio magnus TaxID=698827 RepID=UPI000696E3B0|nr:prepilin-type N-terminal cleavage/methylation domain-containing protein [Desulfonatronovibrio magnus]
MNRGLTLVELLIVLLIFSLGWFALLPRLDLTRATPDSWQTLNSHLTAIRQAAIESGVRQKISFAPGQDYFQWQDERLRLSAPVSRIMVNSQQALSGPSNFFIYPTGHMDEVLLVLSTGESMRSEPLSCLMIQSE